MTQPEIDRGSRGRPVRAAQALMNERLRPPPRLEADGIFGPLTERAVRRFQQAHGLEVDGVIGPDTWGALLARAPTPRPRSAPRPSTVAPRPGSTAGPPAVRPAAPARPPAAPAARSASAGSYPRDGRIVVPDHLEMLTTATPDAPWMRVALAEMAIMELPGRPNNARITQYHAATTLGSGVADSVPWCASFVNWCLAQAGYRGTRSAAAASFADWGDPVDPPRFGAIVQIRRARSGHDRATGSSSGNHVGFFVRGGSGHIELLGGNQGDRVKLSTFRLAGYSLRAVRWPKR